MIRVTQYMIDQKEEDENFTLNTLQVIELRCPFIFFPGDDCTCPHEDPSSNDCLECWIKEV